MGFSSLNLGRKSPLQKFGQQDFDSQELSEDDDVSDSDSMHMANKGHESYSSSRFNSLKSQNDHEQHKQHHDFDSISLDDTTTTTSKYLGEEQAQTLVMSMINKQIFGDAFKSMSGKEFYQTRKNVGFGYLPGPGPEIFSPSSSSSSSPSSRSATGAERELKKPIDEISCYQLIVRLVYKHAYFLGLFPKGISYLFQERKH